MATTMDDLLPTAKDLQKKLALAEAEKAAASARKLAAEEAEKKALLDHFAGFAPLGLVVHSAGKSCHGWFPLKGANSRQIEAFRHEAFVLGADRALFRNKSQFVRMPDGVRSVGGRRQTTYFFDPEVFRHAA